MFCPLARMPPTIANTPITTAVIRATRTSLSAVTFPRLITLA